MHDSNCECIRPENLKDSPDKCCKEQIKKCHGDDEHHCCCDKQD
jgi:hypothetical protein